MKLNRLLLIMLIILLANNMPILVYAKESIFSDIKEHWAEKFILDLYQRGAIDKDAKFRPNDPLKGFELVEMAVRATKPYDEYIVKLYEEKNEAKYIEESFKKLALKKEDKYYPYYEKIILIYPYVFEEFSVAGIKKDLQKPKKEIYRNEVWQIVSWLTPIRLRIDYFSFDDSYYSNLHGYKDMILKRSHLNDEGVSSGSIMIHTNLDIFYDMVGFGILRDETKSLLSEEKYLYPNNICTRAEAAALLSRLCSFLDDRMFEKQMSDCPENDDRTLNLKIDSYTISMVDTDYGEFNKAQVLVYSNKIVNLKVNGNNYDEIDKKSGSDLYELYITKKRFGMPKNRSEPAIMPGYWEMVSCYYKNPGKKNITIEATSLTGQKTKKSITVVVPDLITEELN